MLLRPARGQSLHHRGVVPHEPRQMPQRMLEHRVDADRARRRHRLATGQLGSPYGEREQRIGREARRRFHHRDIGQDDPAILVPPRRRVDDDRPERIRLQYVEHHLGRFRRGGQAHAQRVRVHRLHPEQRAIAHAHRQDLEGLGDEVRRPRDRGDRRPNRLHELGHPASRGAPARSGFTRHSGDRPWSRSRQSSRSPGPGPG